MKHLLVDEGASKSLEPTLMPGFTKMKDGRFFISYVTGPSHVLLGLSFGPALVEPVMICQSNSRCGHGLLDERRIREAVIAGVAAATSKLHPTEIVYVDDDSPRCEIFKHCAFLLAQRVESGAEFQEAT
jgi:hypothetical protein